MKLWLTLVVVDFVLCIASGRVHKSKSTRFSGLAKIVGGRNAKLKEFPYLLSLEFAGFHFCGASAINPNWAVTAAHCLSEIVSIEDVTLRSGSLKREDGGVVYQASSYIIHPEYGSFSFNNDIALVKNIDDVIKIRALVMSKFRKMSSGPAYERFYGSSTTKRTRLSDSQQRNKVKRNYECICDCGVASPTSGPAIRTNRSTITLWIHSFAEKPEKN
uniref:Peptidase S1 domain-containing protein n=1 Tax=Timema monikensis TaxID=170555 RepID=A0A7R9HRY7_9NEOP|nr:unnamed protein product [Timema monikensis]